MEKRNVVVFTASSDPTVLEEIKHGGVKGVSKNRFSLDQLTEMIDKFS